MLGSGHDLCRSAKSPRGQVENENENDPGELYQPYFYEQINAVGEFVVNASWKLTIFVVRIIDHLQHFLTPSMPYSPSGGEQNKGKLENIYCLVQSFVKLWVILK